MVFKKNHYVTLYLTTSHYFLHYVSYVFKYFILLLCIITFNIDYCYMYVLLLHTPSHVWPEFNKLLSIVYCLLSITVEPGPLKHGGQFVRALRCHQGSRI